MKPLTKLLYIFFLFLISLCSRQGHAQIDNLKPISKASYAEKIYLQLSSTVCSLDEELWFKAIVTNSINHTPSSLSGILYVELIDFDERVVEKKTVKIEKGIGHSFFQFQDTYAPGRYLIRAYTEWNKNFDQDFIFSEYTHLYDAKTQDESLQPIKEVALTETGSDSLQLTAIVQPRVVDRNFRGKLTVYVDVDSQKDSTIVKKDETGRYILNVMVPKDAYQAKVKLDLKGIKVKNNKIKFVNSYSKTIVIDEEKVDLQFFPEGGNLVNGLKSKLAFKAVNYDGKGVAVSGAIVDENNNLIEPFKSNALGMGFIYLTANINKKLYAKITKWNGTEYKYPIPKPIASGYVMSVINTGKFVNVNVTTNIFVNTSLYLDIKSRGVLLDHLSLNKKQKDYNIVLHSSSLPDGIMKMTLLNAQKQPVCERLFFNRVTEKQQNTLAVTSTKINYNQREKTTLKVQTDTAANVSVLVLNKDKLGSMHKTRSTILSYFLLSSELKGIVETPHYYFDENNKTRFRDLDILMLTQGWRNYKFNESGIGNFKFQPEQQLNISGSVGEMLNPRTRSKKPLELTLMAFGDGINVFSKELDSTGKFNFNLNDIYKDEVEYVIQTKNHKNKQKNYTINIDKKTPPEIRYLEQEDKQVVDTIIKAYQKSQEVFRQTDQGFQLAEGTVELDEVELSGYKITPEREAVADLHGLPDVVIDEEELHGEIKSWSYGLYSVLLFSFPEDIEITRVKLTPEDLSTNLFAQVHGADYTYYIIDGKPVHKDFYYLLESLPTKQIKSVEILQNPKNKSKYFIEVGRNPLIESPGFDAFIVIYTYAGRGLFGIQPTKGIYKKKISGFVPPREFYIPKYDNIQPDDWQFPDLRSVVYWKPNIVIGKEKETTLEFYNGDDIGEMLVIVESIDKYGRLGYKELKYTVREEEEKY
jgi:hypothetical protein